MEKYRSITARLFWLMPEPIHTFVWKYTHYLVSKCYHNGAHVGYRWDYKPHLKFKGE